jgi:hypothetical protein
MADKHIPIWQVAFIESHLTAPHGPARIAAIPTAYNYGFEVDEIVALTEFPKWRVQQVILREAVNRTNDD